MVCQPCAGCPLWALREVGGLGRIRHVFDVGMTAEELAEMPPGPELAAVLARVDGSRLNGFELVELAKATSRQVAHYQGELPRSTYRGHASSATRPPACPSWRRGGWST